MSRCTLGQTYVEVPKDGSWIAGDLADARHQLIQMERPYPGVPTMPGDVRHEHGHTVVIEGRRTPSITCYRGQGMALVRHGQAKLCVQTG